MRGEYVADPVFDVCPHGLLRSGSVLSLVENGFTCVLCLFNVFSVGVSCDSMCLRASRHPVVFVVA